MRERFAARRAWGYFQAAKLEQFGCIFSQPFLLQFSSQPIAEEWLLPLVARKPCLHSFAG